MSTPPITDRFEVIETLSSDTWRVHDLGDHGRPRRLVALTAQGVPRRRITAARRMLSWMRNPGLATPTDLVVNSGVLYAVENEGRGEPLSAWVERSRPGTEEILRLSIEACERVLWLHRLHPRGLILGAMGFGNWTISSEGLLQLCGLHVDAFAILKGTVPIHFTAEAAPTDTTGVWHAPEPARDRRSDVWCLGMLTRQLIHLELEACHRAHGETPRWPRSVLRVMRRALSVEPEKRPPTVGHLRNELLAALRRLDSGDGLRGLGRRLIAPFSARRLAHIAAVLMLAAATVLAGVELQRRWLEIGVAGWGSAADGRGVVWMEGRVGPLLAPPLTDPYSGLPVAAYRVSVERRIRREVLNRETREYSQTERWEVARDERRAVPFELVDATGSVRVWPQDVPLLWTRAEVVWRLGEHEAPPTTAGKVPIPSTVRPGEILQEIVVRHTRVATGETICVRGLANGQVLTAASDGPVAIFAGTRVDWVGWVLRGLLPALGPFLVLLPLTLLAGLLTWRRWAALSPVRDRRGAGKV